jgi:hypothetical protein
MWESEVPGLSSHLTVISLYCFCFLFFTIRISNVSLLFFISYVLSLCNVYLKFVLIQFVCVCACVCITMGLEQDFAIARKAVQ